MTNATHRIHISPLPQSPRTTPSLKAPPVNMVTPEAGKSPDNWSAVLGAVATFLGALAAWFYRKAGQTPRPLTETQRYDADMLREALEPLREQLENLTSSLRETSTKVSRIDGRLDVFSLRLARVEGHLQDNGD